jgi:hypothetical protein
MSDLFYKQASERMMLLNIDLEISDKIIIDDCNKDKSISFYLIFQTSNINTIYKLCVA